MTKKNEKPVVTETETPTVEEVDSNPEAIVPAETTSTLAALLGDNNDLFMRYYGENVNRVAKELPSDTALMKIIDAIPDETAADSISEIIKRISGHRKGVYNTDERPDLPELRIFHGTGNDVNRPENQQPGQFYLTSKENVGKEFIGTVLLVYSGNTMWPPNDSSGGTTRGAPQCISLDRKVGSTYGECKACPNRPWRDGKPNACANDVVAIMLTKNLKDLVIVRFSKTSEAAGRMLMKFAKRGTYPWSKWYKLTLQEEKKERNRWFKMQVEPVADEYVPEYLHPFGDAMCTMLEAKQYLPGLASIYRQARETLEENTGNSAGPALAGAAPAGGTGDYGDMDDVPEEGKAP